MEVPYERVDTPGSSTDRKLQKKTMAADKLWPGVESTYEYRDKENNGTSREGGEKGFLPEQKVFKCDPALTREVWRVWNTMYSYADDM